MVKNKGQAISFDEDDRINFLKQFTGSKSARKKKEAKKNQKHNKKPSNSSKFKKTSKFSYEQTTKPPDVLEEIQYSDHDDVNNVSVQVTTKVFK